MGESGEPFVWFVVNSYPFDLTSASPPDDRLAFGRRPLPVSPVWTKPLARSTRLRRQVGEGGLGDEGLDTLVAAGRVHQQRQCAKWRSRGRATVPGRTPRSRSRPTPSAFGRDLVAATCPPSRPVDRPSASCRGRPKRRQGAAAAICKPRARRCRLGGRRRAARAPTASPSSPGKVAVGRRDQFPAPLNVFCLSLVRAR